MIDHILSVRNRSWEWFKQRADSPHALFWLALLAFLEPTFSPIVPETLMVAMVLARTDRWAWYAAVASIASIAGGIFGYLVGFALFKSLGHIILDAYGSGAWAARVEEMFSENVFTTMAFVTSTPVPDKVFVIIAGFLQINFVLYLAGYVLGRSVRIFAVAWLLKQFGPRVLAIADRYLGWVALLFMVGLVIVLLEAFGLLHISLPW